MDRSYTGSLKWAARLAIRRLIVELDVKTPFKKVSLSKQSNLHFSELESKSEFFFTLDYLALPSK